MFPLVLTLRTRPFLSESLALFSSLNKKPVLKCLWLGSCDFSTRTVQEFSAHVDTHVPISAGGSNSSPLLWCRVAQMCLINAAYIIYRFLSCADGGRKVLKKSKKVFPFSTDSNVLVHFRMLTEERRMLC